MREILKVTPDYSVRYYVLDRDRIAAAPLPLNNAVAGELTRKSRSRLRTAIAFMKYLTELKSVHASGYARPVAYRLTFVTLTLSSTQIHSDHFIKRYMLQPFLRVARNRWKVTNYVWKAEVQDNGNIHFHVITDRFIPWKEIRTVWNTIQEVHGYVSRSGLSDPNSSDIHALYKVKHTVNYLSSYLLKKDYYKKDLNRCSPADHYYSELGSVLACDLRSREVVGVKRGVEGKLFDCSRELKGISVRCEVTLDVDAELDVIRSGGGLITDEGLYKVYSFRPSESVTPRIDQVLRSSLKDTNRDSSADYDGFPF